MGGHPELTVGAADAALDHITNAEVTHRPLVFGRRPLNRDHRKRLEARQFRDDVVDQPPDKTRLVGPPAEIREWHDRDERAPRRRTNRWPLGLRKDQSI